ncbi:nuclear transport factor 2 family protein [Kitasatospora sp. NPDC057904]|uniref:nuclear transport factor 2 family protein n=1 Tax=Kitasatospora sp. NPDC057904 TaxID=3346275 RepID=UPI0036D91589
MNDFRARFDSSGIEGLLKDYFDLLYTQDMDLFERVFHPDSVLYSAQDGEVVVRPRAAYRAVMEGRQSPTEAGAPRHDEILLIDVLSPEMALVKVRLRLFGNTMEDYLNLLKVGERWTVAAKLYHRAA